MEDTHNGLHGALVRRLVGLVSTPEPVLAQTLSLSLMEEPVLNKTLEQQQSQRLVSCESAHLASRMPMSVSSSTHLLVSTTKNTKIKRMLSSQ